MAILKHISSKNADYSQSVDYLTFQHNEKTNKPILDENGNMIPREEYYIDGINCDPQMFGIECKELNKEWGKNQNRGDIKSHHYIISFDPLDKAEGRLNGERAQELGMEFAKRFFPGHQCLVATHTDGNNESGNIHVHIVLNSLRKMDVPKENWMDRPGDCLAGHKHHLTDDTLKYFKQELMEMCQRESLNQIDLLSPADKKVTDKEYRAKQRAQDKLEKHPQVSGATDTPVKTTFETEKDKIRGSIDSVLTDVTDMDTFIKRMREQYGIEVSVRRGRVAYKASGQDKAMTDKALGSRYGTESLEKIFNENLSKERQIFGNIWDPTLGAMRNDPHHKAHKYDRKYGYENDPIATLYISSGSRLITDIQELEKDKLSKARKQEVELANLKSMVKTICWIERHGYDTVEKIQDIHSTSAEKLRSAEGGLEEIKADLNNVNEQIHYLGVYLANRDIYKQFSSAPMKGAFRKEHEKEISDYEAARKWLNERFPRTEDGKPTWPKMSDLKARKEDILIQRKRSYQSCKYYRDQEKDLGVIENNIGVIFSRAGNGEAPDRTEERNTERNAAEKQQTRQQQTQRQTKPEAKKSTHGEDR